MPGDARRDGAAPSLFDRAIADEVATLFGSWRWTTLSTLLGLLLFCVALGGEAPTGAVAWWMLALLANQAWRAALTRAYHRVRPPPARAPVWGWRWALGSFVAGALWGGAAVAFYPAAPAHQALLIVCMFGVALGGVNLTAVFRPAFYAFALPTLTPLIVRVATTGDTVHASIAGVMSIVLAFLLAFGAGVNALVTRSLMIRHENTDLIASLKAQTAVAEAARGAAEAANRSKSQFLAAASHDLRQPLHALGLFAAALSLKVRDADLRPLVGSINDSVEALEGLFAQLLDLSRLEAGALQVAPVRMAIAPLFARLAADFGPQAAAAGLALRIRPTTLWIESDPLLLERLLRNLVCNALRYTPRGGALVAARRRGNGVRIDVVDTGIGIAARDCDRVFADFVQVGAGPRHHVGGRGMGLGLAIVRRIADLLQHRMELASRPGRGSRFSIGVPLAEPPAEPMPPRSTAPSTAQPMHRDLARRCVVAIDDDPAVLAAMRALIESWGARVLAAGTADRLRESLAGLGIDAVDLVVADLRLADGRCGLAEIARVREQVGESIPALLVSGDTGAEARALAAAAGVRLLAKPVVAAELEAALAAALDRSARALAPQPGPSPVCEEVRTRSFRGSRPLSP